MDLKEMKINFFLPTPVIEKMIAPSSEGAVVMVNLMVSIIL
jgi:hypothetical protein